MEILFWLLPPVVVTLAAMAWVSWIAREGRGEVDREVAAERLAEALRRPHPGRATQAPAPPRDRSTGIAVRPSRRPVAAADQTRRSA